MNERIDNNESNHTIEWAEARWLYGQSAARLERFAEDHPTLYHGTDKEGAKKILETGAVGEMQLSFTPDYSVAKGYANEKDGIVVSIKTKDINPRWLQNTFEDRERYKDEGTVVIQVGRPILGQEPMIIKTAVVKDDKE